MFRRITRSDLKLAVIALAGYALIAVPFGVMTGLFTFTLAEPKSLIRTALIALILPAFFEEVVFRGPVIWAARRKGPFPIRVAAVSLVLFVLWHLLNATFILTEARAWFYDWRFLIAATGLGLTATGLALQTRSLWPPILFHWLAVIGWKAGLGAPAFL